MKSVGLITSWKYNYGSVLQCYATRKTVEKLGFNCELIYERNRGIARYRQKILRMAHLAIKSVGCRNFYKAYKRYKRSAAKDASKISQKSADHISFFAQTELQPRPCSHRLLKQIGKSDKYIKFIAGSDQIWSPSAALNPICFLTFAPDEKKIALAPSFGSDFVPKFNRRQLAKYIKHFPVLSAREMGGVKIIKELTQRDAIRLPDPSIMLTSDEWRNFASCGKTVDKPYVFVHFLNKPSSRATEILRELSKGTDYKIIVFAYPHNEFDNIANVEFVDGSPKDYINLIDKATLVLSDSFHTSVFSIYMKTPFLTFERDYNGIASQSSRLETLLDLYNYSDRYIPNIDKRDLSMLLELPLNDCEAVISAEREKIINYISNALDVESSKHSKLKDDYSCTGCGACVAACPKNAIKFVSHPTYDYLIPKIDEAECIECGLCEKICNGKAIRHHFQNEAYIAYNMNSELRKKSASGGAFSAIATRIIAEGGAVVGATITFDNDNISVQHKVARSREELLPILNSKYVQSDCSEIYPIVKDLLKSNKKVLFSGTSCQVDALYRYLGNIKANNLYTVDLICHGVPGIGVFRAYIKYLEHKNKCKITDFSFRKKTGSTNFYLINISAKKDDENICIEIPMRKSSYYSFFMSADTYRESCYNCPYSTIDKPSDITLGDYYEAQVDYPELFDGTVAKLDMSKGVSSIIIHSEKGKELFADAMNDIWHYQVDPLRVQASHAELCKPQTYTSNRKKFFEMYKKAGFSKIERHFKRRVAIKSFIKKLLRRS